MRFRLPLAVALLICAWEGASAERIIYELYDVSDPANRSLLEQGTKEYAATDVIVERKIVDKVSHWSKEIPIVAGFNAGAVIYRERQLTGFALQLRRRGGLIGLLSQGGESWDWFDREGDVFFRKRQGGGRVKVTFVPSDQFEEIAAVEVLDDITLRVAHRPWQFPGQADTHHLLVKRGSVLRFAP